MSEDYCCFDSLFHLKAPQMVTVVQTNCGAYGAYVMVRVSASIVKKVERIKAEERDRKPRKEFLEEQHAQEKAPCPSATLILKAGTGCRLLRCLRVDAEQGA